MSGGVSLRASRERKTCGSALSGYSCAIAPNAARAASVRPVVIRSMVLLISPWNLELPPIVKYAAAAMMITRITPAPIITGREIFLARAGMRDCAAVGSSTEKPVVRGAVDEPAVAPLDAPIAAPAAAPVAAPVAAPPGANVDVDEPAVAFGAPVVGGSFATRVSSL